MSKPYPHRLLWHGFLLLLLGLVTGIAVRAFHNPRLAVAAHLIGVFDGALVMILAWAWQHFALTERLKSLLFFCILVGAYGGWGCNLLGAAFGTSRMTPIAGSGFRGAPWQEALVTAGLVTVAAALILMCLIALYGLRSRGPGSDA